MMCSACKWYKAFGTESSDQCLHEKAEKRIGGIRSEFSVTHLNCESMLLNRCYDHKLFEPALVEWHDYKASERTDRAIVTQLGDLTTFGRPMRQGE